ncbi:MAG TPA: YbaK/EbsC family protein [Syntrophomonadaceae bacterium]|nr:YbaK/EbsC family protein [Syntrophomonadaceae bacterium]HNX28399.1 YbaK/EbsC family protein [Syntrophomonadaceae bacterium]HPR92669.1 YbaK/EbsC family protein [Syntrophomonadaceae bacterium]
MDKIEKVRKYLKSKNPELKIIVLEDDTSTSFLAAQALGTEVGQIAKSILFKTKDENFMMIVSAGDARIDNKAVKELTGSRVRMANAEEVEQVTGFSIGGVCPFALQQEVPIFLDESLKRYDVVYAAAGTANTALPISFEELCRITGGQPCRVSLTA